MSGPLTQLAAFGHQSKAVTSTDYSPFKTVVRRVTPFATAPKEIQFNGQTNYGKTMQAHVPRVADLLTKVWIVIETTPVATTDAGGNNVFKCVDDPARAMINEVSFEAGSINYQTIYPDYMVFKEECCVTNEKHTPDLTGKMIPGTSSGNEAGMIAMAYRKNRWWVKVPFYFSRTYGHALPVVNLHLTDVVFKIKLNNKADVIVPIAGENSPPALASTDFAIDNMYMIGEYVYLSDIERAKFANASHAYLIEQTQRFTTSVPANVTQATAKLTFNHPCKAFYWYGITNSNAAAKDWLNWTGQEDGKSYALQGELFDKASIKLNNNVRVQEMGPKYYGVIQMKQHHSRIPALQLYMFSFCLAPESVQPSGNLNASRIETIQLTLKFSKALAEAFEWVVYAENYNVVKIKGGIMMLSWAS